MLNEIYHFSDLKRQSTSDLFLNMLLQRVHANLPVEARWLTYVKKMYRKAMHCHMTPLPCNRTVPSFFKNFNHCTSNSISCAVNFLIEKYIRSKSELNQK